MPNDYSIGQRGLTHQLIQISALGEECPRAKRKGEGACNLFQTRCYPGLSSASATASGVKLTSPITPPNWKEVEKQYVLVVTTSVRSLNLEMTGVVLGDMVTTSARGGAFQNPHMTAVLSGSIQARGVISNQGMTVKELEKNDAEWEPHKGLSHDCLWVEG